MAAEGDPVRERGLLLREERLDRALVGDEGAERRVCRGDPLGHGHHVGLDPVAGRPEPVADAAEAADDLVGHEQEPVLVADLAHALEVALGRGDRAGRVLDGLENDRRDGLRPLVLHDAVDLVGALQVAAGLLRAVRAAVAVRHRRAQAAGQEGLELGAERRAPVDGERAHGRPVVGAAARHELVAGRLAAQPVVLARDLERRLDRLGAAADEEDAADVDRDELGDLLGELDRGRRREPDPVREERKRVELLLRGLGDPRPGPVADVDAVERRERVEVAVALVVPDVAPLAALDHELRRACRGEVPPEVVRRRCRQFVLLPLRAARACLAFTASQSSMRC